MSLLQRIIDKLTPDCGHTTEIARLQNDLRQACAAVAAGSKGLEALQARYDTLNARHTAVVAETAALTDAIVAAHPNGEPYIGPVESLIAQRERVRKRESELVQAIVDLTSRVVGFETRITELLEDAEESTARIVDLDQRLAAALPDAERERATQLSLVVDGACEVASIAEDEVILDQVVELPLLLIGIFFDQSQPGRHHHWVFHYFGVKAAMPIADREFVSRVAEGKQVFRAGDVILADVHVITRRDHESHLYPEFIAVRLVKKVTHADQARSLFGTEIDLTAPVVAAPEKLAAGRKRSRRKVADTAPPSPAEVPLSPTCACGSPLTKPERNLGRCERCAVQDALDRRVANGTLITREQAAEAAREVL